MIDQFECGFIIECLNNFYDCFFVVHGCRLL